MTTFASGPEREIQQFDWFLSGLELAVPADSGNFRNKIKICQLFVSYGSRWLITSELRFDDIHLVRICC